MKKQGRGKGRDEMKGDKDEQDKTRQDRGENGKGIVMSDWNMTKGATGGGDQRIIQSVIIRYGRRKGGRNRMRDRGASPDRESTSLSQEYS